MCPRFLTGCIPDPPHVLEQLQSIVLPRKTFAIEELPDEVDLSESHGFPPIGTQKTLDCTCFAICHYCKTYDEGVELWWSVNIHDHQFSPSYVYNQIKLPSGGSQPSKCYDVLQAQGCCSRTRFPYIEDVTKLPTRYHVDCAAPYKTKTIDYNGVKRSFACFSYETLHAWREILADTRLLTTTIPYSDEFQNPPKNGIIDDAITITGDREYHQVCVCGYALDVDGSGTSAFKIANSHGTGWGNQGFAWLTEKFITDGECPAYYMLDGETPPKNLRVYKKNIIMWDGPPSLNYNIYKQSDSHRFHVIGTVKGNSYGLVPKGTYSVGVYGSDCMPVVKTITETYDMLIFVSPQYSDDYEIFNAIQAYKTAVNNDIGWNLHVIKITTLNNRYNVISEYIKNMYDQYSIKACLMIGEDMGANLNVFDVIGEKLCNQSVVPWCTVGDPYQTAPECDLQILISEISMYVPISLLYPNADDNYNTKKNQLITTLRRFSTDRGKQYGSNIVAVCDDASTDVMMLEGNLPVVGDTIIYPNPDQGIVNDIIADEYLVVLAAGDGSPDNIVLNPSEFIVDYHAVNIQTPLLIVDGHGTEAWHTAIDEDCLYQPPSSVKPWFGHAIFENPNLQAIVAGAPIGGHDVDSNPYGFVCSRCLHKMLDGRTIAEAMKDMTSYGSQNTMFGDPTFHFGGV